MKVSKQIRREAKRLFRYCIADGRLDEGRARKVVRRIRESHHRGCLALLRLFERLVKLEFARHTAKVDSAVPLPPDLQASVRAELEGA